MKITVHIERLVLDGLTVTPAERPAMRVAVEKELTRLLARDGLSHQLRSAGALPRVTGGNLRLSQGNKPAQLGRQVARAVHSGIGNGNR
jgi:hypothetical protein